MRRSLFVIAMLLCAGRAASAPTLEPRLGLGVDLAWDSNVYNGRGPDFVTRITPRLALLLHDPRYFVDLGYTLGIWVYALGKAKSSLNNQGDVVFEGRLTRRLTLRVADEIIDAHDPAFLSRAGVVAPQTSVFDNTLEALATYRLARRVDGALGYSYRHTSFGPPPPGTDPLFDGDEQDGVAAVAFRITHTDQVRLADRFSYYTAVGHGLALADVPTLAWHHQLLPTLDWRFEAGPIFYHLLDEGRLLGTRGSGTTVRAAALLRYADRHWRATLTFDRDLVGGTGAATVLWAEFLAAQVGYHAERRFDLRLGASVFANGSAPDRPRLFDGVTVDALADFTLYRGLHLAGYYAFRFQEAPAHDPLAPLPQITRHIAGVRLAWVWGGEAHHHVPGALPP